MELLEKGLNIQQIVSAWTDGPAKVLQLNDRGSLSEGKRGDIMIFDPKYQWVYKEEDIISGSKNSPFIGRKLKGRIMATISGGKVVYKDKEISI
jgi:dihydroorotase